MLLSVMVCAADTGRAGAAGDCPVGTGCVANNDCSTANCNTTTKTCQ